MKPISIYNILLLKHPHENKWLFLKRGSSKKVFPNHYTGIGGKLELEQREDQNPLMSVYRELEEETGLKSTEVGGVKHLLTTLVDREDELIMLLWCTGTLKEIRDIVCNEGDLEWVAEENLDNLNFIPTAKQPLKYLIANFQNMDHKAAVYDKDLRLIFSN